MNIQFSTNHDGDLIVNNDNTLWNWGYNANLKSPLFLWLCSKQIGLGNLFDDVKGPRRKCEISRESREEAGSAIELFRLLPLIGEEFDLETDTRGLAYFTDGSNKVRYQCLLREGKVHYVHNTMEEIKREIDSRECFTLGAKDIKPFVDAYIKFFSKTPTLGIYQEELPAIASLLGRL